MRTTTGTPIWRFPQHDDTYRWHHLKAEPTTDSDSAAVTWYILGVDVDEQFKAQEALKASEREAREILDRVPAMISIRTEEGIAYTNKRLAAPDGTIVYMNKTATTYCGRTLEEVQQTGWRDLIYPDDREEIFLHWKRLLEEGGWIGHCASISGLRWTVDDFIQSPPVFLMVPENSPHFIPSCWIQLPKRMRNWLCCNPRSRCRE